MSERSRYRSDTFKSAPLSVLYLVSAIRSLPMVRAVWRGVGRHVWRVLNPAELRWLTEEFCRRVRLSVTPNSRIQAITQALIAENGRERPECLITIQTPSRKLGNRDNHLEEVLNSFVQRTKSPHRCEILIKVDEDDDLSFYRGIKEKFRALNLRFFVTPRGRGYGDAHIHHSILAENASPTSRAWSFASDDALFCRNHWDLDIYDLINSAPAFITGSQPLKAVIEIIDADPGKPNTIFAYACEPYPVVSRSLIDGLRVASKDLDGWTMFGDRFCFDGLWSGITHLLHDKYGIDIYYQLEPHCVRYAQRFSWSRDPKRMAVRSEAATHFFSPASVETRSRVVERLVTTGLLNHLPAAGTVKEQVDR